MIIIIVTKKTSTLAINLDASALQKGIMLSEVHPSSGESNYKTILNAKPLEDAWNISGDWIPEDVHTVDGNNGTDDYLAYSFYVINVGEQDVNLTFVTRITEATKKLDETIRIRIYIQDEEPANYAKKASDGGLETHYAEKVFESDNSIINVIGSLTPSDYVRVTILMWIEGDDPDTTNDKIGGTISLEAFFKVIEN